MPPERNRDANEWEEHVERKEMRVRRRVWIWDKEVETIVEDKEEGDDKGLGDFDAVYAGENVDAIWAEDGDRCHVDVVEESELEERS